MPISPKPSTNSLNSSEPSKFLSNLLNASVKPLYFSMILLLTCYRSMSILPYSEVVFIMGSFSRDLMKLVEPFWSAFRVAGQC